MINLFNGRLQIAPNEDGYAGTAPVGCFKPNGYGLYDMIGNVWEWTSDWYRPGHPREATVNPSGPALQDLALTAGQSPSRVIKGGSFLCASNYCSRYRPAARHPQEVDLGAAHLGFRTVLNRGPVSGSKSDHATPRNSPRLPDRTGRIAWPRAAKRGATLPVWDHCLSAASPKQRIVNCSAGPCCAPPSWNGKHYGSLHPRHRVASDRLRQIDHPARYPRRPHLGEPRRTPAVAD
jgi:hypothetical protein